MVPNRTVTLDELAVDNVTVNTNVPAFSRAATELIASVGVAAGGGCESSLAMIPVAEAVVIRALAEAAERTTEKASFVS
jgi:hypothetical protein